MTGQTSLPKAIGRATAQVTEVAPVAGGEVAAAPPVVPEADEPGPGTSIGRDEALDIPPRRRLAPLVILLLLVLAGVGTAVYLMTRPPAVVTPPTPRDAAIDARAVIADAAQDAAAPLPILEDAAVPIDAGKAHTIRGDAGHSHPDARVQALPIDAAATPPPSGTGYFTAIHKGDIYLDVIVDGRKVGVTPILNARPLPAGPHTIDLVAPDTGQVVVHKVVDVTDGMRFQVAPP